MFVVTLATILQAENVLLHSVARLVKIISIPVDMNSSIIRNILSRPVWTSAAVVRHPFLGPLHTDNADVSPGCKNNELNLSFNSVCGCENLKEN